MNHYETDQIVTGVVSGIEDYGVFLKIDDKFTGLIHISEISDAFVDDIEDYFKLGEEVSAKVISVDDKNKQLKLTTKYKYRDKKDSIKLEEVGNGFSVLQDKLNDWIAEKKVKNSNLNDKK